VRATRQRLRGHDVLLVAAGTTFFAALAIVPLAFVCVRLAAVVGGDAVAGRIDRVVTAVAPRGAGAAAGTRALIDAALAAPISVLAAAVVPATLYGEGVRRALDRLRGGVRNGDVRDSGIRRAVRGRVLALAGLAVVPAGLVLVAFAGAAVTGAARSGIADRALGAYLSFLLMWGIATVALVATYALGTPTRLRVSAVAWGAAGTGSFVAGMTIGLIQLLQVPLDYGRFYGGFRAAGLLALTGGWLWMLHTVVLVGFAVTRALAEDEGCWRPGRTADASSPVSARR
jgi:membrane protein